MNDRSGSEPSVLFLCTANYFRSRFAHLYFNFLVGSDTGWQADSRGLMTGLHGLRGLSHHAQDALRARGVPVRRADRRNPIQVTAQDIARASHVIAMYRREHEPMVLHRFPDLAHRVAYWDIQDIDEMQPGQTLAHCQVQVETLLATLQRMASRDRGKHR